MANQNSVAGFPGGLFTQSITGTVETALTVPATGVFPSLPSPTFATGTGLWVGVPPDIQGSDFDGHPFKVRVAGKVFTGGAATLVTKLYTVPSAIAAASTAGTLANDVVVLTNAASAAITGASNFIVEAQFIWDSASKILGTSAGINQAAGAAVTPTLASPTLTYTAGQTLSLLNFIPSFTFSAGNAANTITLTEFVIERV